MSLPFQSFNKPSILFNKPFKASSKMNHQLHSPSYSFIHFDFSLVSSFLFLPRFSIYFSKSSKLFASNPTSIAEIHLQSLKSAHSLKSLRIQLRSSKSPQIQLRLLKSAVIIMLKVNELVVPVVSSTSTSNTESISLSSKFEEEMKVASRLRKFAFNDLKLATRKWDFMHNIQRIPENGNSPNGEATGGPVTV
ncbi:unnamed protein product [Lupinus luteus]|uniref:Uncharacterized protein n=1 Tax=Lupinus luteus TaxID=3873 RepID=A0AAV1XHL7_LUPLU